MAEHLATAPSAPHASEIEVLFARQPILDRDGRLAGYELLYRGEGHEGPHAATSRVAASALSDLGLRSATGGAPAFLNVTTEFLLAMDPLPFGPEGVVLEIAADRVPDEPLIERLRRLRQHGYMLALDGFAGQPAAMPLLELVQLAKVDARDGGSIPLASLVQALRGIGVRAVANGLDTHQDHDRCADAGFELFQGDFVCRPREITGHHVPTASAGALRLAAGISAGDTGLEMLEQAIAFDPGLSLRLLRFVNSAAFSLRHEIKSVRQAVVLLGPAPCASGRCSCCSRVSARRAGRCWSPPCRAGERARPSRAGSAPTTPTPTSSRGCCRRSMRSWTRRWRSRSPTCRWRPTSLLRSCAGPAARAAR
ncbi:HDOD domain-containing protein [Baekduia soli]|uniref:HDOD domain-containing protein n=1 Tax=Baekduia soli TaxID=496014 RepID=A0A5B8U8H5_9ACTN|nr:HDOD domain-containing protein [Baekduia soli]QEC49257.1 HDOD domain-containing protein [Baekduia soli]